MAKHVLVAGSLHYDTVINAERFPVAGQCLAGKSVLYLPGGKGGNQAIASARNGTKTWFAGRIGDDAPGKVLSDNLVNSGIDISMLQTGVGESSGMSVAIVNPYGEFSAVSVSAANQDFDANAVTIPPDTAYLVLQNELPEAANLVLAQKARDAGTQVILNASPERTANTALMALTDILILGQAEAEALNGQDFSSSASALEAVVPLSELTGRVIVMLGAGGLVHMQSGGRAEYHPAFKGRPESMHGAADFFVGAFASQMAGGSEFEAAIHYGQAAAAVFVSTPVERRDIIRATQIRARLGEDEL